MASLRTLHSFLWPLLGVACGVILAGLPGGPWGAPLVGLGLGLSYNVFRRFPLKSSTCQELKLADIAEFQGPSCLKLVEQSVAVNIDNRRQVKLSATGGTLNLAWPRFWPKLEKELLITGWLQPDDLTFRAEVIKGAEGTFKYYPRFRHLIGALFLLSVGVIWWMLQMVGW